MSYRIHILCCDDQALTRRAIAEFIEDGVYFDCLAFQLSLDSSDAYATDWETLGIFYDNMPVPVLSEWIDQY